MPDVKCRRKTPTWKIWLLGFTGLALLMVGFGLWISVAAERRWAAMKTRALEILQEQLSRPADRPVLRGVAMPGNAWEDYENALACAGAMPQRDSAILEAFYRTFARRFLPPRPDRRDVEALLPAHGAALAHLRKGAGRSTSIGHSRKPDGTRLNPLNENHVNRLFQLACAQARVDADHGREGEAVELLLDLGQFARDVSCGTSRRDKTISYRVLDAMTLELRPLILSNRLSVSELVKVSRELEVLERALPIGGSMEVSDIMETGFEFLEAQNLFVALHGDPARGLRDVAASSWGGWRYGFFDRLMVADAFEEGLDLARTSEASRGASWEDQKKLMKELQERMTESRNPLVRAYVFGMGSWGMLSRLGLARVRLLRSAAHYRATGEFLDLDDPFGQKLGRAENACRYILWSVGRDGTDHGGHGAWNPYEGRDIVLEIDR